MTSRDITLLNSLVDYVKDVKPYHSKIKQFLSELFFNDNFNVNITDKLNWTLYHQNQWSINDVNGYQLQRLCEGIENDKIFKIPSVIWPRFSITDNTEQYPPGDDPIDWNGISSSSSHFIAGDTNYIIDGDFTKYRVPFHQGSRVYINNIQQEYNVDYFVDSTRGYIRFAIAPTTGQHIKVQLFKTDRLFIAFNVPFDFADNRVNRDYDIFAFDMLPYDSSESDLITNDNDADAWNIVIDSSYPEGHWPILFYNAYHFSFKKAELKLLSLSGINGDSWRITAIGPWSFKVQKNQTGKIWFAYFKTIFDNGEISFIIDKTWSDYYLIPDSNTYQSTPLDKTDFLIDLSVITEHGAVIDPVPPIHRPMEFVMNSISTEGGYDFEGFDDYGFNEPEASYAPSFTIGHVKLITENTANGPADFYAFVLNEIPMRGTYVELQVEQNGQLNPWINTKIKDDMYLQVTWGADTLVNQFDPLDSSGQTIISYTIPGGTSKLIHNVNITDLMEYIELKEVNELILYHNRNEYYTVDIMNGLIPIVLPNIYLHNYTGGAMVPMDSIGIDKQRIIISFSTPMSVIVTLRLIP